VKTVKKIRLKQNNRTEYNITGFFPNGQGSQFDRYRIDIDGRQVVFEEPIIKALFTAPFEVELDEKGNEIRKD
jgi:hypothetical protein